MTHRHLLTQRLLLIPLSSFREPTVASESLTVRHRKTHQEEVTDHTALYKSNRDTQSKERTRIESLKELEETSNSLKAGRISF